MQIDSLRRGNSQFDFKLKQYSDANEDLRRKVLELSEQNKNIPEYEKRIRLLSE